MFESLDDHMKHDQAMESTPAQRILRWVAAIVATVMVLFGLYFAIRMLEG